jgi:hypothetical protein
MNVPMHTKDLFIHHRSHRKAIEAISECFPELDVISTFALVIEPINPINRCALVVASQDKEVLRVLHLVSQEKSNRLETLLTSVNIITQKEIIRCGRKATIFE